MARIQQPRKQQIKSAWGAGAQRAGGVGIGANRPAQSRNKMKSSWAPDPSPSPSGGGGVTPAPPTLKPWDTTYELVKSQLGTSRDNTTAAIGERRNQIRRAYGLDAGFTDNPYSQAVMLQRNYDQNRAGSRNSMAAAGQFLSGAMNRQMREGDFAYGAATDQARRRQEGDLAELTMQEQAAQAEYARQLAEAEWRRLEAARNNPAVPAPPGGAAAQPPKVQTGGVSAGKGNNRIGVGGAQKVTPKKRKPQMTSRWG